MWASKSLYSHVGIVEVSEGKKYVIEAIFKVSRTPLNKWIKRGRLGRYAVFRYKNAGIPIGKFEKIEDLDVDNSVVRSLIKSRWRKHPLCTKSVKKFEECWNIILNDELVTPESIARDSNLEKIWT